MTAPAIPGLAFRRQITRRSTFPLIWQARRATVDAVDQTGTLVRTTTQSAIDSFGTTYSCYHSQPRWYAVDLDGDTVRETVGLFLVTDYLKWALRLKPVAMSGLIDFVENSALSGSGTIFSLTNDAADSPALWITSTSTQYRLNHHNGTTQVTSTMSGTAPTTGDRVRLRWWLYADGKIQLFQQINSAAETSASASSANTLGAAWAGTPDFRLNAVGTGTTGSSVFLGAVVSLGNQTQATLMEALV